MVPSACFAIGTRGVDAVAAVAALVTEGGGNVTREGAVISRREGRGNITRERGSGRVVRVGIFLDFVSSATRTPHGGASYAQKGGRNRIEPH